MSKRWRLDRNADNQEFYFEQRLRKHWCYKDSPSAPQPPNPSTVASAQTGSNVNTAEAQYALNNPNVNTPLGSQTFAQTGSTHIGGQNPLSYTDWLNQTYPNGVPQTGTPSYVNGDGGTVSGTPGIDPGQQYSSYLQSAQGNAGMDVPTYTQNISLNPQSQQLLSQTLQQQLGLSGTANQLMPQVQQSLANQQFPNYQSLQDTAKQASDAYYKQQTQYLDPQWQQAGAQQDSKLANQGVMQGSEAYNNAQTLFNNQKQQAYNNAQQNAIQAGPQLASQNLGLQTQAATTPLNELNALMSGSQVQTPQFGQANPSNVAPTNYGQYAYGSYGGLQDIYNQQVGTNNANTGAMAGVGSAALMAMAI